MLGWFILFVIAAVAGFRRGAIDGKVVVAMAAISVLFVVVAVVGRAAMTPLALQPGALGIALGLLGYFLPLMAGFALGVVAKKQRLRNATEDDGQA